MDQSERPQYYEGQYLGAEDLAAIVRYARVGQARHALGAHTWGIALGLELVERPLPDGSVALSLTPGYGWDGIGRPIVVLAPASVGLTLFENFQDVTDPSGLPVEIWLSYHELPTHSPAAGFAACREGQLYERVIESYTLEALRPPIDNTHSVSIAARSFDPKNAVSAFNASGETLYDESVPYQAFPDSGDLPRWRLFVGIARWVNEASKSPRLVKRTDDDLNSTRRKRRYIGVVSETIQAPDGVLRLRDRGNDPDDKTLNFQPPLPKPPSPAPDKDLVWVEGNLRVIGDARLVAGKLDYRVQKGGDGGIPVLLRRIDATNPAKTKLEAALGTPPPGTQASFAVSSLDSSGNASPRLTVAMDTGDVGIGTESPTAQLHLHSTDAQVGAQQGNLQFFSQTADVEYDGGSDKLFVFKDTGGTTAFVGGSIGLGTTTPAGKLAVHSDNPAQGDILLFSATADFEYDGGGDGLFVFKDTGGKTAFIGGNVGIGTAAPAAILSVNGDLAVDQSPSAAPRALASGATLVWNDGTWLRLNQNRDYTKPIFGVHTPGVFSSGSLNVGGVAGWADPGAGNLWIAGSAWKNTPGGSWDNPSDERLKKDIRPIEGALEQMLRLKGVTFAWREPEKHGATSGRYMGMVAQDVEEIFPEWVKSMPTGLKALSPVGFEALAVEAIRELGAKCDRMEEEIRRLRQRAGSKPISPEEKPRSARHPAKK